MSGLSVSTIDNASISSLSRGDDQSVTMETDSAPLPGLMSYEARKIILVVNLAVVGQIVGVVGIAGNVINIAVFTRQGFSDSVNINFLALAVGDLCSLITLQWFNICVNPWFQKLDLPFSPLEIQSLTAGYPHNCFVRITGWITAFVAFERCLCVVVPLKVKSIITVRVAVFFNVSVFGLSFLSMLPVYTTAYYDWKFYPQYNRSLVGILYTSNKNSVLGISLFISDFFGPLTAFAIVIVCTGIISIQLRKKAKWRNDISGKAIVSGEIPGKEKRVIVMVTTISVIFITCFTPMTLLMTARAMVPGLSIIGRYANLNWSVVSIGFLLETVNSSVNVLVYYTMSSKYKETVNSMLSCCRTGRGLE
ncbi:N-formyl peptide receptor 2 [Aplysia californica]|uniref:N-formyl peptide receptor 2 n=1 Tax=Aplysia californica TaxID=6500 RepID=A0ABM0JDS1_APLCA|nr:N-formyl peptide receptor 2 [Aplysia californica]